jgi:hypothetical protein
VRTAFSGTKDSSAGVVVAMVWWHMRRGTGKVGELGAGRDNKEALEPILLERFR